MSYDEIMNDDNIQFVLFRPSLNKDNPTGITILKKRALSKEDIDGYTYKGMFNNKTDTIEFVK